MVFLGILATTFHVGASRIQRNSATETAGMTPTMSSTPTEVSVPERINGRRVRTIMPGSGLAPTQSKLRSAAGTFGDQGRGPSDSRPAVTDSPSPGSKGSSLDIPSNQVPSVFDDDAENAARVSCSPCPSKGQFVCASMKSLRTIAMAGPGKETDKKQVNNRRHRSSRFSDKLTVVHPLERGCSKMSKKSLIGRLRRSSTLDRANTVKTC